MNSGAIYSQRCWIDGQLKEATIYFEKGKIRDVQTGSYKEGTNVGNAVLMPGVIDAHVHVNEPGRTDWEGFETATNAAAAGGITSIVDMPLNANPVTTTFAALQQKLEASKGKLQVNCGFYGGLVPGNFDALEALIKNGILGVKAFLTHSGIDEFPNVTKQDLEEAMPLIAQHQIPLLVHCELESPDANHELANHPTSYQAYLNSRPKDWENKAVQLMIDLCRKYRCKVHIVHVSSAEALPLIKKAKEEGLPLTAETCPQYLLFNAENISDGNTLYKCAPPIREEKNNGLLKEALGNGTLDFITTDHSPAPPNIKEIESGNLQKAWGGIAGLQWLLPASWTALTPTLSIQKFIPLLTEKPAQFLGIHQYKGFLKKGYDADFTIWQPEEKLVVSKESVFHKHKISPYIGQELLGTVQQTFVGGQLIYTHQKIVNQNCGSWLLRK